MCKLVSPFVLFSPLPVINGGRGLSNWTNIVELISTHSGVSSSQELAAWLPDSLKRGRSGEDVVKVH